MSTSAHSPGVATVLFDSQTECVRATRPTGSQRGQQGWMLWGNRIPLSQVRIPIIRAHNKVCSNDLFMNQWMGPVEAD